MDKSKDKQVGNSHYSEAEIDVIKSFQKRIGYISKKRLKELDDEMYETTRVTLDNLTSDDL